MSKYAAPACVLSIPQHPTAWTAVVSEPQTSAGEAVLTNLTSCMRSSFVWIGPTVQFGPLKTSQNGVGPAFCLASGGKAYDWVFVTAYCRNIVARIVLMVLVFVTAQSAMRLSVDP